MLRSIDGSSEPIFDNFFTRKKNIFWEMVRIKPAPLETLVWFGDDGFTTFECRQHADRDVVFVVGDIVGERYESFDSYVM